MDNPRPGYRGTEQSRALNILPAGRTLVRSASQASPPRAVRLSERDKPSRFLYLRPERNIAKRLKRDYSRSVKIACLIPGGLGGTQKAGWLFADGLARLGHEVAGYSAMGPFVPEHPVQGLSVEIIANECDSFEAIADGRFDALHVHMPGYYIRHPIYPFLKALGKRRPRVVETNVFGWLQDWRANPVTDYRLFVSMTSAWQAASRAGKKLRALAHCSVARNLLGPAPAFSSGERQKMRHELGFSDDDIVALRFGRPDAAKWTDLECFTTMRLRREGGEKLKLLVMEPTEELKMRIEAGEFGDGIVVRAVEPFPARVAAIVNACDILFHVARFGESFGYSIAEGMAAGKPVITRTVPWGDNAPLELVEHGSTGFVCCSLEGLAQALHLLVADPSLRNAMGAAGCDRIHRLVTPESECRIVAGALAGEEEPLRTRWSEILEFARTLPRREWNVIEKTNPQLFADAPALLRHELRYSSRYKARKRLSALRADLRTLCGRTAY